MLIIACTLIASGCSKSTSDTESVTLIHLKEKTVFTELSKINKIEKTIDSAKSTNKIVDANKADYQLIFSSKNSSSEKVDLYLDFETDTGFILKEGKDNAFDLSKKSIAELEQVLFN